MHYVLDEQAFTALQTLYPVPHTIPLSASTKVLWTPLGYHLKPVSQEFEKQFMEDEYGFIQIMKTSGSAYGITLYRGVSVVVSPGGGRWGVVKEEPIYHAGNCLIQELPVSKIVAEYPGAPLKIVGILPQ